MRESSSARLGRLGVAAAALALAGCGLEPVAQRPGSEVRPAVAPRPVAAPAAGATHVVKRGETLYSIAAERGLDVRELARWNKLDDPAKISVGQTLRLSPYEESRTAAAAAPDSPQVQVGAARGAGPVEARPLDATPGAQAAQNSGSSAGGLRTSPKALRLPYSAENVALLSKGALPAPAAAKPAAPEGERGAGGIDFVWPAKGRVLAGYSEPNNRGVDIGGRIGDPIVAAAAGRVMYVGTSIRGYGKLIVIKHDNDFNSVYAHNKEILVKEGQNVARGQKIAELGDTESDKPKLHFEIRKSGKPVDPLKYLPGNAP
jgi:lipoprotein NlpD